LHYVIINPAIIKALGKEGNKTMVREAPSMTRHVAKACRFVAAVAFGVAVLLLSAEPQSPAVVPSIVIGISAATISCLMPWFPRRRQVGHSADMASNDP
jgi:hypothetical protein